MWWRLNLPDRLSPILKRKEKELMSKRRNGKNSGSRRIYVASGMRFDLPIHVFGKPEFDLAKFLSNPKAFGLVVLPGGEDLHPSLYGHKKHEKCGYTSLERDQRDLMVAWTAIKNGIPIIGICRGAQLLNVIEGGYLIQHCDNHTFWHNLKTSDERTIYVSSTHHQMMVPPTSGNYELLAWASQNLSTEYYTQDGRFDSALHPEVEPDVIAFSGIKAVGFQYHPEYMEGGSEAVRYFQEVASEKLGIPVVRRRHQGNFVSLPKEPQTRQKAEEELRVIKSFTEEQLSRYYLDKYKSGFIEGTVRNYMSVLYDKDEAEELAISEYEEYCKIALEATASN